MSLNESINDIRRVHQTGQDKYTYFLLAAAGAAIAFAIQKTEGMLLSWWLLPVAIATVLWAGSFFSGCRNLYWVQASLSANFSLLELHNGSHAQQPQNPDELATALRGVNKALSHNTSRAKLFGDLQFRLLIAGAIFFIAWRVSDMVRLTFCAQL
ncbi:hypothetical protein [Hylemonella gracilis]|uniref:hypothetical protein n=1 Tax=Hylemonella gracilis TaxID=80880 RepID=UPI00103E1FCC|nr:hypothetical protein [Hylemonella gracilis]